MESNNKVEARKAMDMAEKKLSENDYVVAKKFVNKAQHLYPDLEGLKQVLMIIDVFVSASNNSIGESDWYGIMGVDPLADEEAVKKQYKKLALLLHPDKNRFNGAEEAFKLVSEAWCVLSDKSQRCAYDRKRKPKDVKQHKCRKKQKTTEPHHEEPSSCNDDWNRYAEEDFHSSFSDYWNRYASGFFKRVKMFWTQCNRCKIYSEFGTPDYLNKIVSCPNCSHAFVATEITPEMVNGRPVFKFPSPYQQQSTSGSTGDANQGGGRVIRGIEEIAAAAATGNEKLYS